MRFHSQIRLFRALVSAECCLLRWTLRGAKCFRAALGVRLCAIPVVGLASLSVLASLALAAVLLSIPVDYARAHSSGTATHHAETDPLHKAAELGDVAGINHFIVEHGLDVNAQAGILKATPLHWAAGRGHLSAVTALLEAGADVNAETSSGGYTPLALAGQGGHTVVYPALIAAGGYWGNEDCGRFLTTNPAGPTPPCALIAVCAAPSVRNAGTNLCDCPSPNVGKDGAAGPGDCAAPSVESCGGLTPAKFYDSAAGECAAFAACAAPAVRNAGTNLCDCPAPNAGKDGAVEPGDCAVPSVESCGGLTPAKFYDSAGGKCAAVAACLAPAVLNARVNLCDCPSPNIGTDRAVGPGDCAAPSVESCGGLTPAQFYDSAAGECAAFAVCLAPAVRNTGTNLCDCPSPNVGTDGAAGPGDCAAPSVESCGGLTPAQVLRFGGGGMRGVCGLRRAGG